MNADLKEKDFNHDSRIPSNQIKENNKIMNMHQGTQATNTIFCGNDKLCICTSTKGQGHTELLKVQQPRYAGLHYGMNNKNEEKKLLMMDYFSSTIGCFSAD